MNLLVLSPIRRSVARLKWQKPTRMLTAGAVACETSGGMSVDAAHFR
jgi:hypothetical protein